jgi:hypothetical protein
MPDEDVPKRPIFKLIPAAASYRNLRVAEVILVVASFCTLFLLWKIVGLLTVLVNYVSIGK